MSLYTRYGVGGFLGLGTALSVLVSALSSASLAQEIEVVTDSPEVATEIVVPDDLKSVEEYFHFIEKTSSENEPADNSQQAVKAHEAKMARMVGQVIEKVMALEPNEQETIQAFFFRMQALSMLARQGDAEAIKQLDEASVDAKAHEITDVQAVGMKFFIESNFAKWPLLSKEEKEAVLAEVKKYLLQGEPGGYQVNTLMTIVSVLQQYQDEELATPLLAALVPRFAESPNQQLQKISERLKAMLRRLELPGNTMELSGTLLDGSELDWESYRGKVVLVDFWATWCGPCRQEVPNVLRLYEQYHDQGFEVLGVSLDDEKEQAESYISQYSLPWPNLYSEKPGEQGWDAPMAVYYGVSGIPLAILVDAEGKVISMQARGPNLAKELAAIFDKE